MYNLMKDLFPITRSITGDGLRESLELIRQEIPIKVHEVCTGTQAFDWTVPKEWNIREAYIKDPNGNVIVDFKTNNLHVVNYSVPVSMSIDLDELQTHLYSAEDMPDAIPYVTSYYEERWGFCLPHKQRINLKEGRYTVFIDSELRDGSLSYGELVISGEQTEEIFLSTYLCHPSMANNELSGPVVMVQLVKWLMSKPRRYSYRIVLCPEIIGSIVYLSRNLETLKKNVVAGLNFTTLGVGGTFSFMPSRYGNTYADKVALATLKQSNARFVTHSFLERGSDERHYCSPGVDMPFVSIMRAKYGEYAEYHTSLDNLDLIQPEILEGSLSMMKSCLTNFEANRTYKSVVVGEPQLSKRNMYPTIVPSTDEIMDFLNIIAYSDGSNDLLDLCELLDIKLNDLLPSVTKLVDAGLLKELCPIR